MSEFGGSFVLLVPRDLLTRDDIWINLTDLYKEFLEIPEAIEDQALRAQIDNYFQKLLPEDPMKDDWDKAIHSTHLEYPILIEPDRNLNCTGSIPFWVRVSVSCHMLTTAGIPVIVPPMEDISH